MVEDITTGLSRMKWPLVIARNSSFTFRGRAVDRERKWVANSVYDTSWRAESARLEAGFASPPS